MLHFAHLLNRHCVKFCCQLEVKWASIYHNICILWYPDLGKHTPDSYFPTGNLQQHSQFRFLFQIIWHFSMLEPWTGGIFPLRHLSYFPQMSLHFLYNNYSCSPRIFFVCAFILAHTAMLTKLLNFYVFLLSTIELGYGFHLFLSARSMVDNRKSRWLHHILPVVKEQHERGMFALLWLLPLSHLLSPEPQPMQWFHSCSGWNLPPQLNLWKSA